MSQRWSTIFKALGNINRLQIVAILSERPNLNVSQLAKELKISIKSTSKHLAMLRSLGVLEYVGRHGHVFYSISPTVPHDIHMAIRLFIR